MTTNKPLRFPGPFGVSVLHDFLICPRRLYFAHVLGMKPERLGRRRLAAKAGRRALMQSHADRRLDQEQAGAWFDGFYSEEVSRAEAAGINILGEEEAHRFRGMLAAYCRDPVNRAARVLFQDKKYFFHIRPGRTRYRFEGRIDLALEIPADLVSKPPGDDRPGTLIVHRLLRFGRRRRISPADLALDLAIDVQALALQRGIFPGLETSVSGGRPLNFWPDLHEVYFLEDLLPFESDAGPYVRDEAGAVLPCRLVETPCLIGQRKQPCQGLRKWCTKQPRGPAAYPAVRPPGRLKEISKNLGRVCAAVRKADYYRSPGDLCLNHCPYPEACRTELKNRGRTLLRPAFHRQAAGYEARS